MEKRRFNVLYAFAFVLAACLAGCVDFERELQHADDPNRAATLIGTLGATVAFLSFAFSSGGFRHHLYNTTKWTGIACLVGTPMYALSTHSMLAGTAMLVTGLIGLVLTRTVLKDDR